MKKYLGIICTFLVILTLSSCGIKKNIDPIEIKGSQLSETQIEKLQTRYERYAEDLEPADQIKDGWSKIQMNTITIGSSDDMEQEIYMTVSGKVFSSYYSYANKMKLTITIKGTVTEEETNTTTEYSGTIDVIYLEGVAYYDVDLKSKVKGDYETTSYTQKELIKGDIDDIEGIIPSLGFTTTDSSIVGLFLSSLDVEDGEVYQDNDTYYYEIEESDKDSSSSSRYSRLSQIKIKFDENYEASEFATYSNYSYKYEGNRTDSTTYMSVKNCLSTIINKPLNANKYIEGSFDFDLGDILG